MNKDENQKKALQRMGEMLARNGRFHDMTQWREKHADLLKKYEDLEPWASLDEKISTRRQSGIHATEMIALLIKDVPLAPTVQSINKAIEWYDQTHKHMGAIGFLKKRSTPQSCFTYKLDELLR